MKRIESETRSASRRGLLRGVAAGCCAAALPLAARSQETLPEQPAIAAAATSELIYVAALKASGGEGRCQAEVWFVPMDGDFVVVTDAKSWRVAAAARSQSVKIWVGDVGRWQQSNGGYRKLPSLIAQSGRIDDADAQAAALDLMGTKYRLSWLVWGPRFRSGLSDGSRVMLRYRPVT